MKEKQQYLLSTLESLGFNTKGKSFERVVELLIQEYIKLAMEIENDNKETFRKELERLLKPSN